MKYILSLILIIITTVSSAQQGTAVSSNFTLNNKKVFNLASSNESFLLNNSTPRLNESIDIDFPYEVYDGQATRFNGRKNWTLNKKEIRFSFGATQFLGDLGGKDQIGTDYRLKDLDWPSTSLMGMIGYRYRFHNLFATTTSISAGILKGDDALTKDQFRSVRNLNFKAPFIDISQRLEFMIYLKEKVGKRYNIRGLKGFKNRNEQVFVFAGVGVIGFITKGQYTQGQDADGKWYRLRPLSTEGQGLLGGTKRHLPVTVIIPMGIGFRIGISREWRIGLETSYVKTFSDYIDDVHGVYYDKNLLAQQKGSKAAELSNKTIDNPDTPLVNEEQWFSAGEQRGDKQKDSYYYLNIVLTKNVTYRNYTKTHKHFKLTKGKYKF